VWMRLPATTAFSFFQAEAGIRDFHVTGVQTCALPISDQGREVAEPVTKPGSVVDSHSSRAGVAAGLQQPTRVRHEPCHSTPIRPCSGWGLPCPAALAPRAVRSYRTLSPLPRALAGGSAVCSRLHFPSAHAAQALPGTLLCGARTFLGALLRRDCLDRLRRRRFSHSHRRNALTSEKLLPAIQRLPRRAGDL